MLLAHRTHIHPCFQELKSSFCAEGGRGGRKETAGCLCIQMRSHSSSPRAGGYPPWITTHSTSAAPERFLSLTHLECSFSFHPDPCKPSQALAVGEPSLSSLLPPLTDIL